MEQSSTMEMTARDYLRVLFRHKWVMLTALITVMAAISAGIEYKTPMYEAQVKMLISGQKQAQAEYYTDIGYSGSRSTQIAMTQSEIVPSDPVIERAVWALSLHKRPFDYEKRFASFIRKPVIDFEVRDFQERISEYSEDQQKALMLRKASEMLRRRLEVEPVRETELFLIKVQDYNPIAATQAANVISRSYVIFDLEQQYAEMRLKYGEKNQSVVQLSEAIEKMKQSLNGAPLPPTEAMGPASVKIIEQAKVPLKPAGIPKWLSYFLGAFLAVFLSIMFAFFYEYIDQTFRSPHEVEKFLGIDFIGSIRKNPKPIEYDPLAEEIYLAAKDRMAKTIVFTSAKQKEGVNDIVAYTAMYMADNLHAKVLVIDGNLRQPTFRKRFNLPEDDALIHVLEGDTPLADGVRNVRENLDALVTTSSVINSIAMLEAYIQHLLKQAREKYDLVLVNSPPIGQYKDAAVIAQAADAAVMVINGSKTRRQVARSALESLTATKTTMLGAVLSHRKLVVPKWIYEWV